MLQHFESITLQNLSKTGSDHCPLLLKCSTFKEDGPKPFRYINAWANNSSFLPLSDKFWNDNPNYGGMLGLHQKFKRLKVVLKAWNKESFGNIFSNLSQAEEKAKTAENIFSSDPTSANRQSLYKAHAELQYANINELSYLKQKSHLNWMELGDRNSKFFQSYVKGRRHLLKIRKIKGENGRCIEDTEGIKKAAVEHFSKVFSATSTQNISEILKYIPLSISVEDNNFLTALPDNEEVKDAVWALNPNSAPGYGATRLSLIPKKEYAASFEDYRPISLSTFLSKINTNILASRILKVLPKIISDQQIAFQKGKDIADHILMVEEMYHEINRKVEGGNMIIKLDLSKAFDRLNWEYLRGILGAFGFNEKTQNLLLANLKATRFSVLVNGTPSGFFKMAGGVKQGDPLSPLLFIIGLEGLSRLLISHHHSGYLSPFNAGRVPNPSHLAYADDLVIFTNGRVRNLLRLSNSISSFLQASGQRVNLLKSKFYTYSSISPQALSAKERALKIQHDRNHLNYLGVPICKAILRKEDCGFLIEHFDRLLSSWYNKSLNSMGRLTLIKYTLSSIPLHLMSVHKLPKSISSNLMKRMANFLWGGRENLNTIGSLGRRYVSQQNEEDWG
ncbi:unnamed protein product [Cuscuta campestris]|uniref:Reverse transcriptase domain-containing protein n=1 Tax=Cuscuta campestris TaxID=132261 RepID=A0A484M2T5_9ASTE|nr:unnamed protein product [Cuscuta campestris]